eukprot:2178850-Amphidinium_carterae.1
MVTQVASPPDAPSERRQQFGGSFTQSLQFHLLVANVLTNVGIQNRLCACQNSIDDYTNNLCRRGKRVVTDAGTALH